MFPYKALPNLVFIFQIPRVIEEELTDEKVAEQNSNQGERHESQETLTTAWELNAKRKQRAKHHLKCWCFEHWSANGSGRTFLLLPTFFFLSHFADNMSSHPRHNGNLRCDVITMNHAGFGYCSFRTFKCRSIFLLKPTGEKQMLT